MRFVKVFGLAVFGLLVACSADDGALVRDGDKGAKMEDAGSFIAWYGGERARMDKMTALAYWKAANSGKADDFDAFSKADLVLKTFHSDPEVFAKIKTFLKDSENMDPVVHRALDVARLAYEENQLPAELLEKMVKKSSEIEQVFNTFRAEMDGKQFSNNDLLEILGESTDTVKRKAAWEALKQVGAKVGPMLVELAVIRNEAATELGYLNYWDMRIRMQEHDPQLLVDLFDALEASTNEPFAKMKAELDGELATRFGIDVKDMQVWHYDNPFFQQAPPSAVMDLDVFYKDKKREDIVELGRTFYTDIGLPLDDLIERSDFFEREGKDQHAFCIDIDREGDVRMLLNIKPTVEWTDTMLHESGHAVYSKYNDMALPFNIRDAAHIFTTEAVAMMFGALAKNPTWLIDYAGADPVMVEKMKAPILEQRRREQLIFARWAMVMFRFEKALYENPTRADLNKFWYDTVERLQMLNRPAGRDVVADWAAKPHFTIAPVYYHNYLLGELFAAHLRTELKALSGHQGPTSTLSFTGRKEFGQWMIDKVFKPGMRWGWPEFVERSTGRNLGAEAFVQEVSAVN